MPDPVVWAKVRAAMKKYMDNRTYWPADDWISIDTNWDLNLFKDEDVRKAALYPVDDTKTITTGFEIVVTFK